MAPIRTDQECLDPTTPTASNAPDGGHLPQESRPDLMGYRRIVILADGASRSSTAKTCYALLRYRREHVAAVLDREQVGLTANDVLGSGGEIPFIGSLSEVPEVDAIFIGISPAGGKLPPEWKAILLDAANRGIDIVSGLHDFLINDSCLTSAASTSGARLIDVRRNSENSVATHAAFAPSNLRIHTVGHDCSVGKMVVALEVERELARRGKATRFLATGQTGIMISGAGVPVDCVVADFISGAVEKSVVQNQDMDMLFIEGQGSLTHPSFSGVTLGLLHGCAPQGMILCYEAGRSSVKELSHVPLRPLAELVELYERAASVRYPSRVIGVAVNGNKLDDAALQQEISRVKGELGLPACDVYRDGPAVLADAVEQLQAEVIG